MVAAKMLVVFSLFLTFSIALGLPRNFQSENSETVDNAIRIPHPTEVSFDDMFAAVQQAYYDTLPGFEATYADVNQLFEEINNEELYTHVTQIVGLDYTTCQKIFEDAYVAANPDGPIEDFAVIIYDALKKMGTLHFIAMKAVQQAVEADAPEGLPRVHDIIVKLAAELEKAVAPLVELITPLLPKLGNDGQQRN